MAEEPTGVKVYYPSGVGQTADIHKEGVDVRVREGHLFVDSNESVIVAVYAPGKWNSAVVL